MSRISDNFEKARSASRDRLSTARDTAAEVAAETTAVAREKMSESKARAAEILGQGKIVVSEKATAAKIAAQDTGRKAADKSTETIDKNPLLVIAGGLALGVVIGALLPRTRTEDKYVGAAAKKVGATALIAYGAAKEVGQEQIENLGLNPDTVRNEFKDLFGNTIQAVMNAALAAFDTVTTSKNK